MKTPLFLLSMSYSRPGISTEIGSLWGRRACNGFDSNRCNRSPVVQIDVGHRVMAVVVARPVDVVVLHEQNHRNTRIGEDLTVRVVESAARIVVLPHFPQIAELHLADYKVRILDSTNGTGAITRVLVDTQRGGRRWSTVGASTNIIEASWRALVDSVEYGLTVAA